MKKLNIYILIGLCVLLLPACSSSTAPKNEEESTVNNPATRYADSLLDDMNRAHVAVDKSNAAINKMEQVVGEAASQME